MRCKRPILATAVLEHLSLRLCSIRFYAGSREAARITGFRCSAGLEPVKVPSSSPFSLSRLTLIGLVQEVTHICLRAYGAIEGFGVVVLILIPSFRVGRASRAGCIFSANGLGQAEPTADNRISSDVPTVYFSICRAAVLYS